MHSRGKSCLCRSSDTPRHLAIALYPTEQKTQTNAREKNEKKKKNEHQRSCETSASLHAGPGWTQKVRGGVSLSLSLCIQM